MLEMDSQHSKMVKMRYYIIIFDKLTYQLFSIRFLVLTILDFTVSRGYGLNIFGFVSVFHPSCDAVNPFSAWTVFIRQILTSTSRGIKTIPTLKECKYF